MACGALPWCRFVEHHELATYLFRILVARAASHFPVNPLEREIRPRVMVE